MEEYKKDYYIQWIIADYTPFEYNGRDYFISAPSREARFLAERIYVTTYDECLKNNLLDDNGIRRLLHKNGLWDDQKEETLQNLIQDVENIKLWIFENYTNSAKRKQFRQALADTNQLIEKMLLDKQTFDTQGAKAVAQLAKQHFLLGSSIYRAKNKPLFKKWWGDKDDDIVQFAYQILNEYNLSDSDFRLLARSAQWRNLWSSRKVGGSLFGKAAVDLSFHQRQLIMWSNIYDSVYKSSECPSDDVIEDDDALDGWMIKQRRQREKESNKSLVEKALTNNKIRNSDQVYIMCEPEDAEKVYDCNDVHGKMRLQQIMKQVKEQGCVSHMGLNDTAMEIRRQAYEKG